MTKVIADITMSLDGFVTGPDPDLEHGLGHGGEPLHVWAFSDDEVDAAELKESTERSGAVVMGRRLFDIIDGPGGWNDEVGYGAEQVGTPPFFVVTHAKPETIAARARLHVRHRRARVRHRAGPSGGRRQGRRHHGRRRRRPAGARRRAPRPAPPAHRADGARCRNPAVPRRGPTRAAPGRRAACHRTQRT